MSQVPVWRGTRLARTGALKQGKQRLTADVASGQPFPPLTSQESEGVSAEFRLVGQDVMHRFRHERRLCGEYASGMDGVCQEALSTIIGLGKILVGRWEESSQ